MSKPSTDRAAITAILNHMKADGWTLTEVNDGEESFSVNNLTSAAVMHVTDVDVATVVMHKGDERGWVWFVLGNSPEEVAADYTTNLDPHLSLLTESWWE